MRQRLGQKLSECLPQELLDELPYLRKLRADMNLEGFGKIMELGLTSEARAEKARKEGKKIVCDTLSTGTEFPILYASPDCFITQLEYGVDIYWGVLRGGADFFELSERYGFGREMCAWCKGNFGALYKGIWTPDLVVCSTGAMCDDAGKAAELLQWFGHNVHFIEVPYRKDFEYDEDTIGLSSGHLTGYTPAALKLLTQEYELLRGKLEELTGNPITDDMLRESIKITNEIRRYSREILDLRVARPTPIGALEAWLTLLGANYMMGDQKAFRDAVKLLKEETQDIIHRGDGVVEEDAVRLAYSGNPFLDQVILNQIEDAGGTLLLFEQPVTFEQINEEKEPCEALAECLLGDLEVQSSQGKIQWILRENEKFNVEGVIYNCQFGCTHSHFEGVMVKKEIEKKLDIPVLLIDTDMPGEHPSGPIAEKIEAFIEMIKNRRSNYHRV